MSQDGLLRYKDKVDIPQQKALTQELLHLYYDDQFAIDTGEYDAILVVVDRYTKMAKFIPTRGDINAAALPMSGLD